MYKKLISIFILLLTSLILTSCWDYRDTNELSIVVGVAIDKNHETNQYHITSEIAKVSPSKDKQLESEFVEAEGKTIFDAIRNLILVSGKKFYWSHAKIMIFSEDVAKEGIYPILDIFARDHELRTTIGVLVSKEKTAKEIIKQKTILYELTSLGIHSMLKEESNNLKIVEAPLYDFIIDYTKQNASGIFTAIKFSEHNKESIEISGIGLFKQDQLKGYLNTNETVVYNFIVDNVKSGLYITKVSNDEMTNDITLEILKNKTSIKPTFKSNKLFIEINTVTEVTIAEIGVKEDFLTKEGRDLLEKKAEEQLSQQIQHLINKVQKEYGFDIFRFDEHTKANNPQYWRMFGEKWEDTFKELEVIVHCDFKITHTGLLKDKLEG